MSNKPSSETKVIKYSPELHIIIIITFRHLRDWVCRIDVRRTFGINPRDVSKAALSSVINQASEYINIHPEEEAVISRKLSQLVY